MLKSNIEDRRYTVLRATVSSLRLVRLIRFEGGKYGVLVGDETLHEEPATLAGRGRAVAAFESAAAAYLQEPLPQSSQSASASL